MHTTRNSIIILVGAIIVIVGGTFVWQQMDPNNRPPAASPNQPAATTTPVVVPTMTTFQSPDLGFSFSYPDSFSVGIQNFMDVAGVRTELILKNKDQDERITVSALLDPKTGKPVSSDPTSYQNALIHNASYDGSGANPKSFSEFQMRNLGDGQFAYIKTGVFEGTLSLSYYVATPKGIAKFSLVSQGVDWTNPSFDPEHDPGHLALKAMLATFHIGS